MRRREFVTALAGAAAWPLGARAQRGERMRRIGVLVAFAEDDPETKTRLTAFRRGLERRGWTEGLNVHIDARFAAGRPAQFQVIAKELVALQPDVILAQTPPITVALQRESPTIPIVFVSVSDPIGSGFAASLARRQYYRHTAVRGGHHRQVAGDAQGDRTAPCARCTLGQSEDNRL